MAPSPPSPAPFLAPDRSPSWDYVAASSFDFPVSFDSRPLRPAPVKVPTIPSHRVSFPMPPPPVVTFPLSALRPEVPKTTPNGTQVGRWTKREHELFLEGLQRFGRSWKKISSLVHTRTLVQIRTHAQKYLQKQSRAAVKAKEAASGFTPVAFPSSLSASPRSGFQLNSVSRLDQLLQDEGSPFTDEYYTSPTAIEDDLLRPLYSEQWGDYPNKRRTVPASTLTVAVPTLRPAFPAPLEPLPVPDSQLLAAHETDNVWL